MASSSATSSSAAATLKSASAANQFQVRHSRMKELVEAHLKQVREIKNFSCVGSGGGGADGGPPQQQVPPALEEILQAVYEAMWELKSHEYIENHFIMDRLKARLQAKRVSK